MTVGLMGHSLYYNRYYKQFSAGYPVELDSKDPTGDLSTGDKASSE